MKEKLIEFITGIKDYCCHKDMKEGDMPFGTADYMHMEELIKELNAEEIKNLDDMAKYFFQIAREIGQPLKDISLELHKPWKQAVTNDKLKEKKQ